MNSEYTNNKIKTYHAPAERADKDSITNDFNLFSDLSNVKEILNALPYIAAILNPQRQIVYSNDSLLKMLNLKSVEELLGYRPGEAINCIHSGDNEGGCGTSESCKYCGAVNTILKCQDTNKKVIDECRIASVINGEQMNFDLLVTASPFEVKGTQYVILSLNDISSEKRKKALEKIFFHDVINTAGTLKGIIELMKDIDDDKELRRFISIADTTSKDLVEEILSQRELIAAENNELKVHREPVFSIDLIRDAVVQILYHPIAVDRSVIIDKNSAELTFTTDSRLLRRIIINILKNALEATPVHNKVKIGCLEDDNYVTIWVNNLEFIPEDVQRQIFLRSFSTKGSNRGLGTYSIKLLGEKYLGGKVYFTTSKSEGTTFYIKLPL
jgi:K+-sensing histidine kinase KdpD